MKEKIYTIPITDALKEAKFCPFCFLYENLLNDAIDYTIGPSYMESDIRAVTDELGFCNEHFKMLLMEQNKLGLALMTHTHVKKLKADIENLYSNENGSKSPKKSMFKKVSNAKTSTIASYVIDSSKSCFVCKKIEDTFSRYLDSFYHLFETDDEIKNLLIASKGMCQTHLGVALDGAKNYMKDKNYEEFKKIVIEKELKSLETLENDLEFFINKFDYKNSNLPWGDKRDVLERAEVILK